MRILLFSIVAFSMIGLILPGGFSEIYVHESGYPFSIQHPDGWTVMDEDEWGGVFIVSDTSGRNGVYVTLACSEVRGDNCGQAGAGYQEMKYLKSDIEWMCENVTIQEDHITCSNHKILDEFTHQLDGYTAVTVLASDTILSDGKDPYFPEAEAGRYQEVKLATYVLVGNDYWWIWVGGEANKFDQELAETILSTFMINNVYAQEDIFYEPSWFENLINAIMSIFGGGTSDTSSVIIEIPTVEDPFTDPNIDWDNPIIIDPRGFDDLFP